MTAINHIIHYISIQILFLRVRFSSWDSQLTATTSKEPIVLLTNENLKTNTEYVEMFNNLVSEYDRRLDEQVKLAKQDMLTELEAQIQVRQHRP